MHPTIAPTQSAISFEGNKLVLFNSEKSLRKFKFAK
jgi:hypothetical protein